MGVGEGFAGSCGVLALLYLIGTTCGQVEP